MGSQETSARAVNTLVARYLDAVSHAPDPGRSRRVQIYGRTLWPTEEQYLEAVHRTFREMLGPCRTAADATETAATSGTSSRGYGASPGVASRRRAAGDIEQF